MKSHFNVQFAIIFKYIASVIVISVWPEMITLIGINGINKSTKPTSWTLSSDVTFKSKIKNKKHFYSAYELKVKMRIVRERFPVTSKYTR